ncbi:MAG: class I SAM-dependent methyltransferase [Candidatus Aminicenantes bacterium]
MNKREFFDQMASQWENDHQKEEEIEKLERLFGNFRLSAGSAVLDVGCGTGRLVPYLRREVGEKGLVVESDFSAEMLRTARRKYPQKNLFYIHADAQIAPLKENIFDAVICFALFPHLPRKKRALEEFRRILKPGKPLFIAHPMSREELNQYHTQVKGPVNQDILPDQQTMEMLFGEAGFCDLVIKDEPSFYLAQAKA